MKNFSIFGENVANKDLKLAATNMYTVIESYFLASKTFFL